MRTLTKMLLVGVLATGCKNKAEDAAKARETANEKAVESARAQREADEKVAAAAREAEATLAKAHVSAQEEFQKDLSASNRKLEYLRSKLVNAKGAVRKNAEAAAHEVEIRKATVETDLANLKNMTGDAFEGAKMRVQAEIASLNQAIENFEDTLD